MKRNRIRWVWGVLSIFAILIAGCSVDKSPTDAKAVGPEITMEVVKEYAPPLTTTTLKLSANALTSYSELKQSNPTAPNGVAGSLDAKEEVYRFENGYHIWEGQVTIPTLEDIWRMEYQRKVQFRTSKKGDILFNSDNADYMYAMAHVLGQFGFTSETPETGEIFEHFIEGEWENLLSNAPTFNGKGYYLKNWKGYYNQELTEVEIRIPFEIKDLSFTPDPEAGYLLKGKIIATFYPFKFYAKFNGTTTAKIVVYQYGLKVGEQTVEIPNLSGWDIKQGFIKPPITSWINSLTDPTSILSGIIPLTQ